MKKTNKKKTYRREKKRKKSWWRNIFLIFNDAKIFMTNVFSKTKSGSSTKFILYLFSFFILTWIFTFNLWNTIVWNFRWSWKRIVLNIILYKYQFSWKRKTALIIKLCCLKSELWLLLVSFCLSRYWTPVAPASSLMTADLSAWPRYGIYLHIARIHSF